MKRNHRRSASIALVILMSASTLCLGQAGAAPAAPAPEAPAAAWETAGAHLPITYDLSALDGNVHYVATAGSDDGGTGSAGAPYATLAKAYGAAAPGDTIVVRGGTYRQGNLTISGSKPVRIIAYPGEVPVFNGAAPAAGGWTSEGSLQYHGYAPMPVTDGNGISFTSGQNLIGDPTGKHPEAAALGRFPDEAWVGSDQLQQVGSKGAVTDGKFFVDHDNSRIYLTTADVAKGGVEVANLRNFIKIQAPGSSIEGLRITRYANSASDYGAVQIMDGGDKVTLRNVEVSDTAFIAVTVATNDHVRLENVTIARSNWMGVNATYTDNLVLDRVYIHELNQWGEFTYSPQSGALKTSRTQHTVVTDSQIRSNHSHGIWFDQSNYDAVVAGNVITDNLGSGVFFEISDRLLLINNYIRTLPNGDRAVKLAGSSGLSLVNNTIVGGADVIGIYVDNRSKPGCADPAQAMCANSYGSDRDTARPHLPTMDWIPRLDLMINNIIAYPTQSGYCGGLTAVCITSSNAGASVPLTTVIHPADDLRPRTIIDGNVYANGTGAVVGSSIGSFASIHAFVGNLRDHGVNIDGYEMSGLYGDTFVNGDGTPTEQLAERHPKAAAVPSDDHINQYVPAGTKHYAVLFR